MKIFNLRVLICQIILFHHKFIIFISKNAQYLFLDIQIFIIILSYYTILKNNYFANFMLIFHINIHFPLIIEKFYFFITKLLIPIYI